MRHKRIGSVLPSFAVATTVAVATISTRAVRPVTGLLTKTIPGAAAASYQRTLCNAFLLHHRRVSTKMTLHEKPTTVCGIGIVSRLTDDDVASTTSTLTATPNMEAQGKAPIATKLIVHFDINETILLGDEAGGDSLQDSLQKMMAKSAFCRLPSPPAPSSSSAAAEMSDSLSTAWEDTTKLTPTHWWDGQPMETTHADEGTAMFVSPPPLYTGWQWPPGCAPYYRTKYKKRSKSFCDHHGKVYHELAQHCHAQLEQSQHGCPILPAFWTTLEHLSQNRDQQPFAIVFRTFGNDLPDLAQAVTQYVRDHADTLSNPHSDLELSMDQLYQGRWKQIDDPNHAESSRWIYQLWDYEETKIVASGDDAILRLLQALPICGIRDDYNHWASNGFHPSTGKPVWIPSWSSMAGDSKTYDHHVIFDDNIHNLPNDGIACMRQEVTNTANASVREFRSMQEVDRWRELHGLHFFRTPTIEPVLNARWFIECLEHAQARLQVELHTSRVST
uniref:Uncharacterized protein n=1 Tax=Craspedostauros australis TaxID=1486917 RepID=A0A7R9ZQ55_9STRA|mmetsp:Transcript_5054/g.13466  ORF Transcript_5054/g.13466 Transcript_5054/m.13466 type:complete len:503 (+) Transcript_5054:78-1586(+)